MATARQIEANRRNAKKSTGPVTAEGKAASSLNHLSHGFTSSTSFIRDENPEDFYNLMADLLDEYRPATTTEQILVEKMFHHQMLSLRAIRLQSERLSTAQPGEPMPADLGLLIRYQQAADRAFHKAHAELVKAQKEREKSEIGFDSQSPAVQAEMPCDQPTNPPEPDRKPVEQTFAAAFQADRDPISDDAAPENEPGTAALLVAA